MIAKKRLKQRPILMGRIAPTPVGTKKSQGRDFKIPTEGRNDPKGGTNRSQGRDEMLPLLENIAVR